MLMLIFYRDTTAKLKNRRNVAAAWRRRGCLCVVMWTWQRYNMFTNL